MSFKNKLKRIVNKKDKGLDEQLKKDFDAASVEIKVILDKYNVIFTTRLKYTEQSITPDLLMIRKPEQQPQGVVMQGPAPR